MVGFRYGARTRPASQVDRWSPTAFSPARFSPHLWLDAGDAETFTYSSGTVVSQWNDRSGNNFHVSQATAAAQPSRSGTRNGIPTVVFDGGDVLSYSGTTNFNVGTASIFIVAGETSTVANSGIVIYHAGTGNDFDRQDAFIANFSVSSPATRFRLNRYTSSTTGYGSVMGSRPTPFGIFYGYLQSNGRIGTSENDVPGQDGQTRTGTFTTAGGGIVVGGRYESGAISATGRINGEIAEIIVYSTLLSYLERRQVIDYLMYKWGI